MRSERFIDGFDQPILLARRIERARQGHTGSRMPSRKRKAASAPGAGATEGGAAEKKATPTKGKKKPKKAPSKPKACNLDCVRDTVSGLKIVTYNVNGLRSLVEKHGSVMGEYFAKEDPDILCLQETKLTAATAAELESDIKAMIPDRTFIWNHCSTKKGYSGTLLACKTPPVGVTFGDGVLAAEGRVVIAEFENFYVVGSYVPNSGMKLDRLDYRTKQWDAAMRSKLVELDEKKPVIWCGDLNVAHADTDVNDWKKKRNKSPGFCDAERENFGIVVGGDGSIITDEQRQKRTAPLGRPGAAGTGLGFVDMWRRLRPGEEGYTFWSYRFNGRGKNNGWRLDYFILSERLCGAAKACERRDCLWGPSDHVPLVLILDTEGCAAAAGQARTKGADA